MFNMFRSWLAILLCISSGSWGVAQPSESQPVYRALEQPSESHPVYRALENAPIDNMVPEDEGSCEVGGGQCMNTLTCIQQGGQHAGVCHHKHLFSTCCLISSEKPAQKELGPIFSEASASLDDLAKLLQEIVRGIIPSIPPSSPVNNATGIEEITEEPNDEEQLPEQEKMHGNRKNKINSLIAIDPLRTGEDCGVIKVTLPEGRIVNGTDAAFGEFPWQVTIRVSKFGSPFAHHCGGTLISRSWVATAAHCLQLISSLEMIKVRIGEHDIAEENEMFPYVERTVIRNLTHPRFDFPTFKFDIALLELNEPVPEQPNIGVICLPGSDNNLRGLEAWATGWGRLRDEGPLPKVLQKVPLTIMKNKACKNSFKTAGRVEPIPKIFLCASDVGRDACTGDSGGPLQVRDSSGRWFLGGIVSWGIGCARPNHPGVYTRISKFMPFIKKSIFNHS